MQSSKYEILNEIANKVQTLDNPIKLKILAMLVEEGSKSVTDISKEMSLNFSTAHKYLEQLEAAGLVTSKQVSENRLKRIFSIGDFNLDISPHGLSNTINKKKAEPKKTFKVINERGEEVQFDEKIFSQKYIKRGLPARTISNALDKVVEQAYDGITLLELRELVRQEMAKKLEIITNVMELIEESEIRGRTYYNLLKLNHPEALKMHMDGDIFIQNLGEPKLLNFVHDLRGIGVHGLNGKKAKDIKEFFEQIYYAINSVNSFSLPYHSFDTFNYFVAPLAKSTNTQELNKQIENFLDGLSLLAAEFFICLELGKPKFVESLLTTHFTEVQIAKAETYEKYHELAQQIAMSVISIVSKKKYDNIKLLLKLWEKKLPDNLLQGTYIANMTEPFQQPNTSFVGPTRFDHHWKKWLGASRMGEVQEIIINLPRLAINATSATDFTNKLNSALDVCYHTLLHIAELTAAEFLRYHDTTLESAQRERWDYLRIENCQYSIGLAGLTETINLLKVKHKTEKLGEIAAQVHKRFLELRKKNPRIRVELKQSRSPQICRRFGEINKSPLNYAAPLAKQQLLKIQKYFAGGHMELLNESQLGDLKYGFGFVRLQD